MRPCCALLVLLACSCGTPATRSDPTRFAPRPEWTPHSYALPAGPLPAVDAAAAISRDDALEDIAYLDHMLASAWPDADGDLGRAVRERAVRAVNAPLSARTRAQLCDALGRQTLRTSLRFAIGGQPCPAGVAADVAPEPLVQVPAGRNYGFLVDGDVAVLAIARFADPDDPGWAGFADALRDLATRELVALDLQRARGDDPRMGFALLAALGRQNVNDLDWRAPAASDGPYAQIARANLAAHAPPQHAPRSRALWARFGEPDDPAAIARALSPVTRDPAHPLEKLVVLVSRDCEPACGLIAVIAHFTSGASPRSQLVGAAPDVGADELGLVRLPHSGIEVTFPTATYGPAIARGPLGGDAAPGFAHQALAALQLVARQRAEARAWNAQPLPACAALARDHQALTHKLGGCPPTSLRLGQATPGAQAVTLEIALDESNARAFLAGCLDLTLGSSSPVEPNATTIVDITAPVATLEQLATAPFVRRLAWSCPVDIK